VPPETPLADAIASELSFAFRKLGAKPEDLVGIDWNDNDAVIAAGHALGASFELLCAIGSRGDTLDDSAVLRYLNAVNHGGTIFRKVISEGE
jgi:hypothetical protein